MSKYPDWTEEEIKILKDNYYSCDKYEGFKTWIKKRKS